MIRPQNYLAVVLLLAASGEQGLVAEESLKVHGIFRSNMVLQRDKPITIWGWAPVGSEVKVSFGAQSAKAKAAGDEGRWEVVFGAQPANAEPQTLTVRAGDATVVMDNILIGDVWVMNGQSNMAFALKAVYQSPFESAQAHLPLMRHVRIRSGAESEYVETNLRDEFINGQDDPNKNWKVVSPEAAPEMGAIGYIFGSRLQRALQIPIGIIDNARGGASLESLVPRHQFADHPDAARVSRLGRSAPGGIQHRRFSPGPDGKVGRGSRQVGETGGGGQGQGREQESQRNRRNPMAASATWSVPGRSPSDAASCYNGMFGVFKGLNIKGVAFHQGFNNAMMNTSCKPKFYRILMKLMVDGLA